MDKCCNGVVADSQQIDVAFESSHRPNEDMPVHRHAAAYAALVLEGGYEETSIDGRFDCSPGVLMIHPAWHAHSDQIGPSGAVVLNLPLKAVDGLAAMRVSNAGEIVKLAQRCPESAGRAALEEAMEHVPLSPAAWMVRLVALIATDPVSDIAVLAMSCGVSPEHASRACKRWFGLGPAAMRREGRLQHAIALLQFGATPTEAAHAAGFSDQPHLTRLLKRATGLSPAKLRLV